MFLMLVVGFTASASAIAAGAAPASGPLPGKSSRPRIDDLGTGVLSSPITGATQDGGSIYLVTRGVTPAVVARYDVATGRVVASAPLPAGTGGWAAAMSGGKVYTGMYPTADIDRYDPATNTASRVVQLPGEQYIWDLATAPDGTLYAGTYPGGELFAVSPDTGQARNLGAVVAGQLYVRAVAAAPDGTIYAGTGGASAHIVAYDPSTGQKTDISPPEVREETFVYDLAANADHLVAGTQPTGRLLIINRRDPSQYKVVDTGQGVVDSVAINGGHVLLTTRASGSVYDYDIAAGTLTELGDPIANDETRGVFSVGGRVVGVAGSGEMWSIDPATGTHTITDLVTAGIPAGPEPVQSVAVLHDEKVAQACVAGNFSLGVHDLRTGKLTRVRDGGEAKKALPVDGRLYMAIYPGAFVDTYDPTSGTVDRKAAIGGEQNRPMAMRLMPGGRELGIGTLIDYGKSGGAFSLFDLRTNAVERYNEVIPHQAVSAIGVAGPVVYLGGNTYTDGIDPVATEASLAAFDLRTRTVLWLWNAIPGALGYDDLIMGGPLLYGLTNSGTIFVADPVRRKVLRTYATADQSGGMFFERGGQLYGATRDTVFRLAVNGPKTLVSGLAGVWFNEPAPAYDEASDSLYTIRGNNLVRIHLGEI
ncbi:hypothetical protein GCM10009765_79870 [Fodinicola feengrottensis]|uniref:PQQ-binding-like beta-propeller repeat protein n=2 Tax=Fodinicola feengrottensis TaxID=435914 RepID=A0ABN2J8P6_9ACTN